jgi:hypothetical protein
MSLARLPPELHTEVLFQILVKSENYGIAQIIKTEITPYILASREALQCWRANRHVILHRVATIQLAATEAYRKGLRRAYVLGRLRACVWQAMYGKVKSAPERWDSVLKKLEKALLPYFIAEIYLEEHEHYADYWRGYLLH